MGQRSRGQRKVLLHTVLPLFTVCLSFTGVVAVSFWRRPSSGPTREGPCSPARRWGGRKQKCRTRQCGGRAQPLLVCILEGLLEQGGAGGAIGARQEGAQVHAQRSCRVAAWSSFLSFSPNLYLQGLYHPCEAPLNCHLGAALGSCSESLILEEQCPLKAGSVVQWKSARAP